MLVVRQRDDCGESPQQIAQGEEVFELHGPLRIDVVRAPGVLQGSQPRAIIALSHGLG